MIPSRTRLVPLLLAVPACAALAPPAPAAFDAAAILGRFQVPVLMTFEKAPQGHPWPTQLDILGEEALQGVGRWDVSGNRAEGEALRRHLALPQAHWVVAGQGGRVLGSGSGPLGLSAFKELLQASGFVSPVQALRTFLKRVPDHLEARERLFQLLRQQAGVLTAARFGDGALPGLKQGRATSSAGIQEGLPKAGLELKGAEDLRIWGGLYRELERAYTSGDWLHRQQGMLVGGPLWEATSPLMRGLLRRHRPTLLAHLRETPWDVNLLRHWAWASVVLGEPLIPTFEGLPPHPEMPKGTAMSTDWPGGSIQAALAFEARATGDWARHGRVMINLWQQGGVRWAFPSDAWLKRVWTDLALPGLESLLRAGMPEAGDIFFQDLGGLPGASDRVAEAVALAGRLGRPDVAQEWQSRRLRPAVPDPWLSFLGLLVTTSPKAPQLSYASGGQEGKPSRVFGVPSLSLARREGWEGTRADRWRAFLGWGAMDTRWALVDGKGRILLEGSEPMNPAEVQKRVNELVLTPDPPLEFDKIRDPWLRHLLMGDALGMLVHELGWASRRREQPLPEASLDALAERIRALDSLREAGWWRRPQLGNFWGSVGELRVEDSRVVHAARAWVAALEGALALRPRSYALWGLWGQWVSLVPDPDFAGLQVRLERHPLDAEPWPPTPLTERWILHARARERWAVVVEVARSRWQDAVQAPPEQRGRGNAWRLWQTVGLPLAEAFVQQGRGHEADQVLVQAEGLGLTRESAVDMTHGYPALRARWKPEGRRS